MKKTKIDWCDCTINPVVGCPNGCKYCYGNRLNDRFHFVADWRKPQFFPNRLAQLNSKKPQSVFIDSMSDIGTWKDEWLREVLDALSNNPLHIYVALTKTDLDVLTKRVIEYSRHTGNSPLLYLGKSITTQAQLDEMCNNGESGDFVSIEPLLERLDISRLHWHVSTLIIGAETGTRKGKVVPQKDWIDEIVKVADEHKLAVFMKESLRTVMGDDFRQDLLPWEVHI